MSIPARLSLVTLGVDDLGRATDFYVALGWPLSPASVAGAVSFFDTAGGRLALYGREALARDAGVAPAATSAVALAINLESRADVDEAFEEVGRVGGTIVKPPEATDWGGYSGYFSDPDGHLWEVAHNPGWPIGADGRPQLPR